MTKSLVVLENHFDGNDTMVVQIEGQKYVSNGCQVFHCGKLDEVCAEIGVNDAAKQLVINALNEINSDCLDLTLVVNFNAKFLKFITNQTEEICLAAVRNDHNSLCHVKSQTEGICLAAVQKDGIMLIHVKNQTEAICLAAVKNDGMALKHVKNQTEAICSAAVTQCAWSLFYVKKQTEVICLAAINSNPNVFHQVENKTKEMENIALSLDSTVLDYSSSNNFGFLPAVVTK